MLDSSLDDWKTLSLADLLSGSLFKDGDWIESKDQSPDGSVRLIQLADIGDGYFIDKSHRFLTYERAKELKCTFLEKGDILVARMPDPIGRCCLFPLDGEESYVTAVDVCILRGKAGIDKKWLTSLINSPAVRSEIEKHATGTTRKRISRSNLGKIRLNAPPLPEQERIAEVLTSVDDSIRATEAVIAQAERVKRGLMEDLLTRDGETVQLSNLSAFITKGATPTTYGFEWQSEGIPFLRSECVSENGFTESGLAYICDDAHAAMERSVIKPGDLLVTITGNVGRVAVLPDDYEEANINQHIARVRIESGEFDRDFVYHFLSSPQQRAHYQSIVTGQAYPQLSLKQIRETEIPVIPMERQKEIASVLNAADAGISLNQQSIDQLQRLKRGLMDDLLTGRVRTV